MELYEAIEKRRTIRKFTAPADQEQLKRILLAGTKAPSGLNSQPWEFVHVTDPAQVEQIAQLKYDITLAALADAPDAPQKAAVQKDCFYNASVVAVCSRPMGEASTWLAVENISLAAVAEGLGSGITFYAGPAKAEIEKLLDLPEGYCLTCVLKIGTPGEEGHDRYDSPYGARRPDFSWLHENTYKAT